MRGPVLPSFTADAVTALTGPRWLARRRADAFDRFLADEPPTEAEEVWRYSGIDSLDLDAYGPAPSADGGSGPGPAAADLAMAHLIADRLGPRTALVVTRNGSVLSVEGGDDGGPVTVSTALGADGDEEPEPFGRLAPARDAFGLLHDAFLADAVFVSVAAKAAVTDPVVVLHIVDPSGSTDGRPAAGGSALSVFPRLAVRLGAAAEAGVVEILVTPADDSSTGRPTQGIALGRSASPAGDKTPAGAALVVPVTELDVADDGHLAYANVQALGPGCVQIATQASRVGAHATLRSFTVGLGGRYARVRTDSDLVGDGGRSALLAAYLGSDHQIHDFRTLQDHHAPRTESELLFKGAVSDRSRSVYSGLIRIRRGARRADARQSNYNLVLSEGAHADSVPNLDIDENDVRCSHASTVGPIDEEQRYYLESRGVEPDIAERLIVQGFFSDLARRAPFDGVGAWVESAVNERLGATFGAKGSDRG